MALNLYLFATEAETTIDATQVSPLHESVINHGLSHAAHALGCRNALWYPEEAGIQRAGYLLQPVGEAIKKMKEESARYRVYYYPPTQNYEQFLAVLEGLFKACQQWPDAYLRVSR